MGKLEGILTGIALSAFGIGWLCFVSWVLVFTIGKL